MSRKDYIAIAEIITRHRDGSFDQLLLDELAKDLCDYCKRDNPRFDATRFMRATKGVQK